MEDTQKKSARMLMLQRLFGAKQAFTVNELVQKLGVNKRTMQRDLAELQGAPYNMCLIREGSRWKLDRNYVVKLPPVVLSREQAIALFIGARLLSQHSGQISPLAEEAIAKLLQALPAQIGSLLQNRELTKEPVTEVQLTAISVFTTLVTGWLEQRKVTCVHQTLGGKTHTYQLAPYTFEPSAVGYAIYVIGHCDEDKTRQLRTLKLDRILEATLTNESFEFVKLVTDQLLQNAWHIWNSDEEPVLVRLRFHKRVSKRVKESQWHPNQQISDLPDGGCEWQAHVAETQEMLPWIRGWGADCEVLAPLSLRSELILEARKLAKLYNVAAVDEPQLPIANMNLEKLQSLIEQTFENFSQKDNNNEGL